MLLALAAKCKQSAAMRVLAYVRKILCPRASTSARCCGVYKPQVVLTAVISKRSFGLGHKKMLVSFRSVKSLKTNFLEL
jgi:hypothetical protein